MVYFNELPNENYIDEKAVDELIQDCGKENLIGLLGVEFYQKAANEMQRVRELYDKADGRQICHYVLSFTGDEVIDQQQALKIGWKVAEYFVQKYQVVYGVHTDTDNIHIHFVVNTVSYMTGERLTDEYDIINQLKEYMRPILKHVYGVELY